ncbi:MAG: hypothetical protein U0L09_05835 [Christensenellales bacterium]|nr:hypothetical protein [Christensenellales bacterium]
MTKAEFAEELIRRGYNARNENGVVMVIGGEKGTLREMERIAEEVGFCGGSYGWRNKNAEV